MILASNRPCYKGKLTGSQEKLRFSFDDGSRNMRSHLILLVSKFSAPTIAFLAF